MAAPIGLFLWSGPKSASAFLFFRDGYAFTGSVIEALRVALAAPD
jgi:hypothetical protein